MTEPPHPVPRLALLRVSRASLRCALMDVSIDVRAGAVLALMGENGAGKSTLLKIMSGAYQPDGGRIE